MFKQTLPLIIATLAITSCGQTENVSEQKLVTRDFSTGETYSYKPDQALIDLMRAEAAKDPLYLKTASIPEGTTRPASERFLPGSDWHPNISIQTRGRATTSMVFIPSASRNDMLTVSSTGTFDGDPNVQPTAKISVNAWIFNKEEVAQRAGQRVNITATAVFNMVNGTTTFKGSGGEVNRSGAMLSFMCPDYPAANGGGTGWRPVAISDNPVDGSVTYSTVLDISSCPGPILLFATAEGRKVIFKELKWTITQAF